MWQIFVTNRVRCKLLFLLHLPLGGKFLINFRNSFKLNNDLMSDDVNSCLYWGYGIKSTKGFFCKLLSRNTLRGGKLGRNGVKPFT